MPEKSKIEDIGQEYNFWFSYIFRHHSDLLVGDADVLGHLRQGRGEGRQVPSVAQDLNIFKHSFNFN